MSDLELTTRAEAERAQLLRSFPAEAKPAARQALALVEPVRYPPVGRIQNSGWPPVTYNGEVLEVPDRIYNEPLSRQLDGHPPEVRAALGCLYSRHHDGYVRQRAIRLALAQDVAWCAPFVVALLGEYVVEIAQDIERFVTRDLPRSPGVVRGLRSFATENPKFLDLTHARATSYRWEYYRHNFPVVERYPPISVLRRLHAGLPVALTPEESP